MLSRPSVDVDLFPDEFTTVNDMERELVENYWFKFSFDKVKMLGLEYLARGLMKTNPLYDPKALMKLKELIG